MEIVLGVFVPAIVVIYVLWLLTRLTRAVERIDFRLQLMERERSEDVV